MKKILFKISFVVICYALLGYVNGILQPLALGDTATLQLQDSNSAYGAFKAIQMVLDYFWILYLLPLLVFVNNIKKLFNNSKGEK